MAVRENFTMKKMPFGKYQGQYLDDVPANYLLWVHENVITTGYLKQYLADNIEGIKKQIADGNGDV